MTDFRALCARMADELDHYRQLLMDDRRETHALAAEARALLAQPEPQGPSETAWALAQLLDGVQRHDLPNMTGLSDSDCDRIWAARPATTGEQQ